MKAVLTADGDAVLVRRGKWRDMIPVADLDRWIAFYERMARRNGGKHRPAYEPDAVALRRVRDRLRKGSES